MGVWRELWSFGNDPREGERESMLFVLPVFPPLPVKGEQAKTLTTLNIG